MNDASLSFDPETSVALGYGFRCGFLGLLHMEIIQQRLEREFDLDLVTTAPSVIYHVIQDRRRPWWTIDNPSNLPPMRRDRAWMEEPLRRPRTIYHAAGVRGRDHGHCAMDKRGVFSDMKYIEGGRVQAHLRDCPSTRSSTSSSISSRAARRGYATLRLRTARATGRASWSSWTFSSTARSCDALSIIVHRDKRLRPRDGALPKSSRTSFRASCSKFPFRRPSAARSSPAKPSRRMRKDVLAKCYGGDITRKKKLLEKQKEGKKRMRQFGTVEVPSEAFLAVLKMNDD